MSKNTVCALLFSVFWVLSGCMDTDNPVNTTEEKPMKYIDLQQYACPEAESVNPYADQMVLYENYVYASLQRRIGFEPCCNSQILKIDILKDSVVEVYDLEYKNISSFLIIDNELYASNPGSSYEIGDGAIERLNLSTGEISTVITEKKMGGSPNQIVHKSGSKFYVQVYLAYENVPIYEIDFNNGIITDTLKGIENAFGGLCYDNKTEKLLIGECATTGAGIKIFENNIQKGGIVSSSLPPSSMCTLNEFLFMTSTDYTAGKLEWMKVNDKTMGKSSMEIGSDAIVREDGSYLYVIERFGSDKLIRIDPANISISGILYEVNLEQESNPVDIEVLNPDKAYVSLQDIPKIVIIDPKTGK